MRVSSSASSRFSRRGIVGGLAALGAVALAKSPGRAAQFEFKCGSNQPADHPVTFVATQMWQTLERESGGRIHVSFFPNSALGGDASMLTQVRQNAIQLFLISPGNLATVVPVSDILNLGFAYDDQDQACRVMDGPVGDYIRQETTAKGMHLFKSIWASGMRIVSSGSHPIRLPEDVRGFKVRTDARISIELWRAFGGSPVQMSAAEMYTGLQTKLLDGVDIPAVSMQAFHIYEVQKYLSLTNHVWGGIWLLGNAEAWASLPPDLQQLFERVNTRFVAQERQRAKVLTLALNDKLGNEGMTVNKVDGAPFRKMLGAYYTSWGSTFGPTAMGLLETAVKRKFS